MFDEPFPADAPLARFSPDRVYRYRLERIVNPLEGRGSVNFIMLNPSTADETVDDPTIRRCIAYARSWGFRRLVVTNLFAFRATDPRALKKAPDPCGPENVSWIKRSAIGADQVVAAWGAHGVYQYAGRNVIWLLHKWHVEVRALALTAANQPVHPLRQRADLKPEIVL